MMVHFYSFNNSSIFHCIAFNNCHTTFVQKLKVKKQQGYKSRRKSIIHKMLFAVSLLQASLSTVHNHRRTHEQQLTQVIQNEGPSAQLLSGITELSYQSFTNAITFDPAAAKTYSILKSAPTKNLLVASQWQAGKILAYGGTLFNINNFYNSQNSTFTLIINSFDWLAGRKCAYKSAEPCKVLFLSSFPDSYRDTILLASLKGITMIPARVNSLVGIDLSKFQIIVAELGTPTDDQTVDKVRTFIKNGGGALFAFMARSFDDVNILQNKVMQSAGIKFTKEAIVLRKIIIPGQTNFDYGLKLPYLPKTTSTPNYSKQGELQKLLTGDAPFMVYSSRYSTVTIPQNFVDIFATQTKSDRFGGAGQFGLGRVVALGLTDLITKAVITSTQSTKKVMKNVLSWVAKNKEAPRVAQLFGAECSAFNFLPGTIYTNVADPSQLTVQLFDVVCFGNFKAVPAELDNFRLAIRTFVQNGGSLIAGANSIEWAKVSPADFLTSFPFNVIFREFGVFVLNNFYTRTQIQVAMVHPDTPKVKTFLQSGMLPLLKKQIASYSASDLALLANYRKVIQSLYSYQFEEVCGWQLYNQLVDAFVASSFNPENGNTPRCSDEPFRSTWQLLYDLTMLAPPEVARALPPAINGYPGVANTNVVTRTIDVPLDRNNWIFTGLYANPGQIFEVKFTEGLWQENPFDVVKLRLNTNDDLTGRGMPCDRSPIMSQTYTLDKTKFSHYGGGFIVILVDRKVPGKVAKITITARQGNLYNQNFNTPDQAPALLRNDSPNIVIECDLLTMQGRGRVNYIANSVDVALTCTYMNLVMKSYEQFGFDIRPFTKQMFHADIRISAGFMHAGNPIQLFEGSFMPTLNIGNSSWKDGNWGIYHELGHNHQDWRWTEMATIEVTNNIYSLWFGNKFAGQSILNRVPQLGPGKFDYQLTLQQDPFLFLGWFAIMMEEFGVDFFEKVQRLYFQRGVNVKNSQQLYDQLCQMYSDITGLNVHSYFVIAKMPVTSKCNDYAIGLSRPQWRSAKYPYFTNYDYKA